MIYECISGVYMMSYLSGSLFNAFPRLLILVVCNFVSLHAHGEIYYFICFKIMNR
jgi:hypothetical protein